MARDIKVNCNQLTVGQLRRMCDKLLSLGDDQRVVTVPGLALEAANTAAALNPAAVDSSGGSSARKKAPATAVATGVVAMELGEGSGDDEAVLKERSKKKKNKGKKNKKSSEPV